MFLHHVARHVLKRICVGDLPRARAHTPVHERAVRCVFARIRERMLSALAFHQSILVHLKTLSLACFTSPFLLPSPTPISLFLTHSLTHSLSHSLCPSLSLLSLLADKQPDLGAGAPRHLFRNLVCGRASRRPRDTPSNKTCLLALAAQLERRRLVLHLTARWVPAYVVEGPSCPRDFCTVPLLSLQNLHTGVGESLHVTYSST